MRAHCNRAVPTSSRSSFSSAMPTIRNPLIAEGEWHGEILPPRGESGFGYDPLFWIAGFQTVAAELDAATKNRLSHRGPGHAETDRPPADAVIALARSIPFSRDRASTATAPNSARFAAARSASTCRGACASVPYCDFNSHEVAGAIPEDRIRRRADHRPAVGLPADLGPPAGRRLFGGGTPSLLSPPPPSTNCFVAFRALAMLSPDAEITLEASPARSRRGSSPFPAPPASTARRWHPELQRRTPSGPWAASTAPPNKRAAQPRSGRPFRLVQPRPDVRPAGPDHGSKRSPTSKPRWPFAPPHLSCYQLTLEPNTRFAAFRRHCRKTICAPTCRKPSKRGWPPPVTPLRDPRPSPGPAEVPAQPQLLAFGDYLGIGAGAIPS